MRRVILICFGILWSQVALAMTPQMYARVMDAVDSRDLNALKQIRASGVDMNSPISNGMTPLCETVAQGDYEGYEMLLTQGATPYVACIRQLPESDVARFYANQPAPHTYYVGQHAEARPSESWGKPVLKGINLPMLGIGEVLVGGIAAAGILTLGRGGSGGNGGGGGDAQNDYIWTAPLDLSTSSFETRQYKADNIYSGYPEVKDSTNFLGAIKASSAYARGYTGYGIKRKSDGTLEGAGEAAINKTKKTKVAVVDDGVWDEHPQLNSNISRQTNKTYNFMYGSCDTNSSSTRCWEKIDEYDEGGITMVDVKLKENGEYVMGRQQAMTKLEWLIYQTETEGYDPNDPTPVVHETWKNKDESEGVVLSPKYKVGDTWYIYNAQNLNPTKPDGLGGWPITCSEDGSSCWYNMKNPEETKDNIYVEAVSKYYNEEGLIVSGYENHGTHVAGLVAAKSDGEEGDSGMMGVAYNADIIPIKFDITMGETMNVVANAVNLGADIVNLSSASTTSRRGDMDELVQAFEYNMEVRPDFLHAYKTAAENNTILVFSAGNYEWTDEPYDSSMFSMAPLSSLLNGTTPTEEGKTYNLTNLFVNVIAVDEKNKLTAYSAKCGVTKDYCIAAPGGSTSKQIYSTVNEDEGYTYGKMMGTSMATPIVSGALAILKGAFPHLTNQQVVQILFETATDLGEPGVDDIYGHGLVNLEAATSPIGLPKIPLSGDVSGKTAEVTQSTSVVPASFASIAKALPTKLVVLDKYDRAFAMPTSSFVHVAKHENKLDGRFKSFMRGDEKVVATNDKFTMAYSERRSNLNSKGINQGSIRFEVRPTTKWSFKSYYTENTETSGGTYFERLMQSPYAKMKEAWGAAVSYDLTKNWKAIVQGQVGQNGFVDEKDLNKMEHNKISLFQSSLQYNGLKKVGLKMVAGVTNEQGSTLGMWGRGAFKSGNSKTTFVGAGVTLNLTDALTLEGMYYSGKTEVNNNCSLVKMSNLKSDSFALTAAWKMNENRILGLQFVSPLRVRRGTARVDVPVARDAYQDIVYRDSVKADLKPSAREYDMGVYFADNLQEDVRLQSEVGVRLNPDHVAGAAPDWRALIGLNFGL